MNRLALTTLLAAAILAASSVAWSQVYLGAAIGSAEASNACEGAPSSLSCGQKENSALRLFAGYRFNPHLAVELGGSYLGSVEARSQLSQETAQISAIDLSAVVSWPLADRFAIYGRLGVYEGDMSTSSLVAAIFPPPPRRGWRSGSNTGVTYGLGASYDFTPHLGVRLEWQRFDKLGGEGGPTLDVDVLSIGGLVRF